MKIAAYVKLKHGGLWEILQRHRMTASEFGRRCGIYPALLGLFLNMKRRPSPVMMGRIQKACSEMGEFADLEAWWPKPFVGMMVTEATLYQDVEPNLLANATVPKALIDDEKNIMLEAAYKDLDTRERTVLQLYAEGKTNKEIGKAIGRTAWRGTQIRQAAIKKLQEKISDGYLQDVAALLAKQGFHSESEPAELVEVLEDYGAAEHFSAVRGMLPVITTKHILAMANQLVHEGHTWRLSSKPFEDVLREHKFPPEYASAVRREMVELSLP